MGMQRSPDYLADLYTEGFIPLILTQLLCMSVFGIVFPVKYIADYLPTLGICYFKPRGITHGTA